MHHIIIGFLLCVCAMYSSGAPYVATFLTEDTQNLLKDKFFRPHEPSSPFYDNTRTIYCEHSTIEFNPTQESLNKYKAHYGHQQTLRILAYAEDEHAQAILVQSTISNDSHPSTNAYPHVTLSVSNKGPYTAVYSNDLWKRLADGKIIQLQLDEYNKPRSVMLNGEANEWRGKLAGTDKYKETQAYVKLINEVVILNGIVCLDTFWKNYNCNTVNI